MQPDAAVPLHAEGRGRLHPAPVAAGRLTALERGDEPVGEVALRSLEPGDHAVDDRRAGQNVPLRCAMSLGGSARLVAGPWRRLGTRVREDVALGIDHRELTAFLGPILRARVGVALPDRFPALLGDDPLAKWRYRTRAVTDIDDRLRRRRADSGLGGEHTVADREDARLHGTADFTRRR